MPGLVARVTAYRSQLVVSESRPGYFDQLEEETVVENDDENPGLRIQYKVIKSLKRDANPCEITISNLGPEQRASFTREPLRVHLEVGTDGIYQHLFVGDIRPGSASELDGGTWETRLLLGDGARALKQASINRTYKSGATMRTIMRDLATSMGLSLPALDDPRLDAKLEIGMTVSGWTGDELAALIAPLGYSFSIQDGVLQILRDGDLAPGEAWKLDEENGMTRPPKAGTPTKKRKIPNYTFFSTPRQEIRPGGLLEVASREVSGRFKVVKVEHTGDTSDLAETEIEGKPI